MDLAHPVRGVVPSLDGPVLAVLAGTTTPQAGREVARLVSTGSRPGVQRVLNRLTAEGVVRAERRSRAVYYSGNRDHLAWPAVEVLANLRAELLRRLTAHVRACRVQPLTAAVHAWTGNRAQPYDISAAELREHVAATEPIVVSWRREALTLAGREVSALLRSAAR